jgi:hypothetical protein
MTQAGQARSTRIYKRRPTPTCRTTSSKEDRRSLGGPHRHLTTIRAVKNLSLFFGRPPDQHEDVRAYGSVKFQNQRGEYVAVARGRSWPGPLDPVGAWVRCRHRSLVRLASRLKGQAPRSRGWHVAHATLNDSAPTAVNPMRRTIAVGGGGGPKKDRDLTFRYSWLV